MSQSHLTWIDENIARYVRTYEEIKHVLIHGTEWIPFKRFLCILFLSDVRYDVRSILWHMYSDRRGYRAYWIIQLNYILWIHFVLTMCARLWQVFQIISIETDVRFFMIFVGDWIWKTYDLRHDTCPCRCIFLVKNFVFQFIIFFISFLLFLYDPQSKVVMISRTLL